MVHLTLSEYSTCDETTLTPKEAEMAIVQLEKVMLNLLNGGYSVKLGDWASFSATVSSSGAERAAIRCLPTER